MDEIGELPLEMQPKLLRILDHGEYSRVGDPQPRTANIRLIAATNRDLPAMITTGEFREDLYYRIAEATIVLPPLRHRLDDFLPLAIHVCNQLEIPPHQSRPTPYALFRWLKHTYLPENPALRGNIREFSGALKRAIAEGALEPLSGSAVPELWHQAHVPFRPLRGLPFVGATTYTEQALRASDYRIARTLGLTPKDEARLLGMTERQFSRRNLLRMSNAARDARHARPQAVLNAYEHRSQAPPRPQGGIVYQLSAARPGQARPLTSNARRLGDVPPMEDLGCRAIVHCGDHR